MNKLFPIVLALMCCLFAERQEVIQRFNSGEKKVVAVYEGNGLNENLIKRYTFSISGKVIKFEDFKNPDNYLVKHSNLLNSEGLEKYLTGFWEIEDKRAYDIYSDIRNDSMCVYQLDMSYMIQDDLPNIEYMCRNIHYDDFLTFNIDEVSFELDIVSDNEAILNFNKGAILNLNKNVSILKRINEIPKDVIDTYLKVDKMINRLYEDSIEDISNITSKKQISFDDAFFLHSNDLAIFIDARDQDEIAKEGQIPDSQNIPVSNIKLIYEGIRNDYNECTDYDAYNWLGEYACGYSDLLDSNFNTKIDSDFEIPRLKMALSDFPIEMKVFNILKNLDKTLNYVVYSGSRDCDKSEDLYSYMTEHMNFEKVMKFSGGWKLWKEKVNE